MATVAFFHAHPDDEAIATGGTMAKLSAAGHTVLCITATRGEHGEVPDGFLAPGETLGERRERELEAACMALGVHYGHFLGYVDSGMMGAKENDAPESFWQADVDEAAQRLAAVLDEHAVDVLVAYDANGNYGHPDHIQVHRVGVRAAELAGTRKVYESTFDRDYFRELMRMAAERGDIPDVPDTDGVEEATFGTPGALITTRVDVRGFLDQKRKAMQAHASQIAETSFFLAMPPDVFELTWGTEFYVLRGAPPGTVEDDLLAGL